jgi:hypothetical protein
LPSVQHNGQSLLHISEASMEAHPGQQSHTPTLLIPSMHDENVCLHSKNLNRFLFQQIFSELK